MTAPHEMKTRVERNTNDIEALYELMEGTDATVKSIAEVQQQHGQRLDRIERTLDGHTEILDSQGEKLDEILGLLRQDE